jgi:hypothetical protein
LWGASSVGFRMSPRFNVAMRPVLAGADSVFEFETSESRR